MQRPYIYIFSILMVFIQGISYSLKAQDIPLQELDTVDSQTAEISVDSLSADQSDTLTISSDTLPAKVIRRVELYIDYLKFVSFALPGELKGEAGLAIITGLNLGIHGEFGYGKKMPEEHLKNADYFVEGMYGRFGLQYHYPYDPGTNFMIGAMYGYSSYRDEATYVIESSLWDDYTDFFSRKNLSGQWVELVAGSESSYKGNLYLGFQVRFRALISHDNFSPFEVFAIPGYGRTMDKTIPALNLYIKYMIDFER